MEVEDDFMDYVEFYNDFDLRRPKRYLRDMENPLESFDDQDFKKRFRFTKHVFVEILLPLISNTQLVTTNRGLPISPLFKMLIALRFYATSSFQLVCADLFCVSQSTVSRIVAEVSEVLSRTIKRFIKFPESPEEINQLKVDFYTKAGFPGVVGLIDGTHIPIKSPGGPNAEVFRNRKAFFSLNVQVVGGPNGKILDLVVRWPGSAHDSRIFENSAVRVKLDEGQIPGHLIGDRGYPQRRYIYTPVPNPVTRPERHYNNSLRVTRSCIERTIGIWKRRFPCLYFEMQNKLKNVTRIITACAILHNIGINAGDIWEREELEGGRNIVDVLVPFVADNARGNEIRQQFIATHFNN